MDSILLHTKCQHLVQHPVVEKPVILLVLQCQHREVILTEDLFMQKKLEYKP